MQQLASRPAIYYFHALLGGSLTEWPHHLDRCKALGFDAVLLSPCFAIGESADIFLVVDHRKAHAQFGDRPALDVLADFAALCRQRKLVPLLDMALDRLDRAAPLVQQHPEYFDIDSGISDYPDPRVDPLLRYAAFCRFDDANARALTNWCIDLLQTFAESVFGGFCFSLISF